jgi:hypothetical protein
LHQHFTRLRTLRGCLLHVFRTNKQPNGPLAIEVSRQPIPNHALPDAPNVEQKLCRIWEVHYTVAPRPIIEDQQPGDDTLGVVG